MRNTRGSLRRSPLTIVNPERNGGAEGTLDSQLSRDRTVQDIFGRLDARDGEGSGIDLATFPEEWIMTADDAVDAALAGLDAGEPVTIPSLPEIGDWESFEKARQTLIPTPSR